MGLKNENFTRNFCFGGYDGGVSLGETVRKLG